MARTPTQEKLEAQRGKAIAELLRESLEEHRAQRRMVTLAALGLGLADATFYQWCRELGIDIDEYRRPASDGVGSAA